MAEPVPEAFQFLPTTNVISGEFTAARDFIVTLDCKKAKLKTIHTRLENDKVNIIVTAKSGQFSADDVSFNHGPSKYDLIITVDTGDLEQLGRFYEDNTELFTRLPLINIDHHASNGHFGKINYVDIMSSATTELLIPLIHDFEHETGQKLMDEDIATLLLAGIITDTGSFQNANTTPRAFASSAQLIKYGARQQEIIQHVFKTKHLSTLRLWGRILSNIRVDKKHRLVWSTISKKDFQETGSREDETGGIIDELMSNAPGTEIVLLLKEKTGGIISGSVRTTTASIDASEVAEMFGGGGHVQAAGFKIPGADIFEIEKMVIDKIRQYQQKRLNLVEEEPQEPKKMALPVFNTEIVRQIPEKTGSPSSEIVIQTPPDHKKEITRGTTDKKAKTGASITKKTPAPSKKAEENFTDILIRKSGADQGDQGVEMEPGVIYKFEE
jgi:phosphoesterase RecJ-like protein